MASTNSTVDGMGFEEINQTGSQTANIWIAGSIKAEIQVEAGSLIASDIRSDGTFTSPAAVISTGSITSLRSTNIYNTQGQLYPSQVGSPVAYSAVVKAGNITTSAGSSGFIKFGNQFSTTAYYVSVTPGSLVDSVSAGSGYYVSGARHKSGCWLIGGPSITYDYIAVGVI